MTMDPSVVNLLTAWAEEHPGEFRLYAPQAPRGPTERIPVYVVHPPEEELVEGVLPPAGTVYGPTVRMYELTPAEAKRLAMDLGFSP